ncbi:MAG: hypothetical protein U5L45_22275 [Saprospiraceae bacterium]|nr:hypothetical protein [Saprospiraceae bacterium]
MRERSARKTSVFNQKTMFLGYAHSSNRVILLVKCLKTQLLSGGGKKLGLFDNFSGSKRTPSVNKAFWRQKPCKPTFGELLKFPERELPLKLSQSQN